MGRNEFNQDQPEDDDLSPLTEIDVEVWAEVPDEVLTLLRQEKDLTTTASHLIKAREKERGSSGE